MLPIGSLYQPNLCNYVSEEQGYTGQDQYMLRARASSVGAWELWNFCCNPENSWWSLQSNSTNNWTSTEIKDTGFRQNVLRARAATIRAWEQYVIYCSDVYEDVPGEFVMQSADNGEFVLTQREAAPNDYLLGANGLNINATTAQFDGFPGC